MGEGLQSDAIAFFSPHKPQATFASIFGFIFSNQQRAICFKEFVHFRLRAVSYLSLLSYYTRNLSTRAARPLVARKEGVRFALALDEIRTGRILREKADCKQSSVLRLILANKKNAEIMLFFLGFKFR